MTKERKKERCEAAGFEDRGRDVSPEGRRPLETGKQETGSLLEPLERNV